MRDRQALQSGRLKQSSKNVRESPERPREPHGGSGRQLFNDGLYGPHACNQSAEHRQRSRQRQRTICDREPQSTPTDILIPEVTSTNVRSTWAEGEIRDFRRLQIVVPLDQASAVPHLTKVERRQAAGIRLKPTEPQRGGPSQWVQPETIWNWPRMPQTSGNGSTSKESGGLLAAVLPALQARTVRGHHGVGDRRGLLVRPLRTCEKRFGRTYAGRATIESIHGPRATLYDEHGSGIQLQAPVVKTGVSFGVRTVRRHAGPGQRAG